MRKHNGQGQSHGRSRLKKRGKRGQQDASSEDEVGSPSFFSDSKRPRDSRVLVATGSGAQWQMTGGDIAVRDAVIAPGPRRTARNTLDRQLIRAQAARARDGFPIHVAKVSSGDSSRSGLTGLQKACIRALCANVGDDGVLDLLAEGRMPERFLLPFVAQLQRAFGADGLPFRVWKRLVQTYDTLPARVKTYRGVVLDDTDQLQRLHLFDASFSFAPPVTVVTLLDLSNTAFDRMDAYKIKVALSRTLVALRLDRLRTFDDDGIADLARGASDGEGAFPNLEILTLRGCNLVTDRSAAKLIGFPALKMLGAFHSAPFSASGQLHLTKPLSLA